MEATAMTDKQEALVLLTKGGAVVGRCIHDPLEDGWRFLPATTSRRPSRKSWPTANKCIPRWAFDLADEMLSASEFSARAKALRGS